MKRNFILTLVSLMLILSLGLFAACSEEKAPAANNNDPVDDSGTTDDPETPADPGTTDDPEKPEDPGTTDDPEKPEDPGTTDEPEKPEDPGTTDEPEKPEDPGTTDEPAHVHSWGAPTITKAATCKDAGIQTRDCSGCDEKKTDIIPKLTDHSYDSGVVSGTTKVYTCTVCGHTRAEEVQTGHTHEWGNPVETKKATCGEKGEVTFSCACGETLTSSIKPTDDHNYKTEVVGGEVITKCTACGQEIDPFATPSDIQ